jgi:hypothetical protein
MNTFALVRRTNTAGTIGINLQYLRDLAVRQPDDYDRIIEAFMSDYQLYVRVKLTKGSTPLYVKLS